MWSPASLTASGGFGTAASAGVVAAAAPSADASAPEKRAKLRLKGTVTPLGFCDAVCELDLPEDAGDVSCLRWHPLRHLLAAGTWGGQVLIYSISDSYTRDERPLTVMSPAEDSSSALLQDANIRGELMHAVPVGVPVLSISWRPCSADTDLQSVLAVSGASSTVALVFADEGVLVPLPPLQGPTPQSPLVTGVCAVGWLHTKASSEDGGANFVQAANNDIIAGEEICTPLVCGSWDNCLHVVHGITGSFLQQLRESIQADPANVDGHAKIVHEHSLRLEGHPFDRLIDGKLTCMDVCGPYVYAGMTPQTNIERKSTPSCNITVFSLGTDGNLFKMQNLDTTLKVCMNQVVANPRRWGSVTASGPESRTNVNHVGDSPDRQKFTYKCHRADGPRTEGNKMAFVPTALEWLRPPSSDFLARLYNRRPHQIAAPGAGDNTALNLAMRQSVDWTLDGGQIAASERVARVPTSTMNTQEVTPEQAVAARGVPGFAPPAVLPPVLPATPLVPSPYYEYLLFRGARYMVSGKTRKKLFDGTLCVSSANDGSLIFWDVDSRMRNVNSRMELIEGDSSRRVCVTNLACDSTGSLLAVSTGPSWSRGDPRRQGQADAEAQQICDDGRSPTRLVLLPITDFMAAK